MNKTSIKIIKRKSVEAAANAKMRDANEAKQNAPPDDEKSKRSSSRKIAGTISTWISDRRENNRIEEDAAKSEVFGFRSSLKEI